MRNLRTLSYEDPDFVKIRTKEAALFYYANYNENVPQHLSKEEIFVSRNLRKNKNKRSRISYYRNYNDNVLQHLSKENLRKNKNIVIQKSDRGNSAVIVDKTDYFEKMKKWKIYTTHVNLKKKKKFKG